VFLTGVSLQQVYVFQANNPYRETPSAFTEGQDKARGGDLNAAVLLLEAAIQQDPQDSEVNLNASLCLVRESFELQHKKTRHWRHENTRNKQSKM